MSTFEPAAQIGLGDFQFDDGFIPVFVLVDKNVALGVDNRLGDVLNHGARAGGGLDHYTLLLNSGPELGSNLANVVVVTRLKRRPVRGEPAIS